MCYICMLNLFPGKIAKEKRFLFDILYTTWHKNPTEMRSPKTKQHMENLKAAMDNHFNTDQAAGRYSRSDPMKAWLGWLLHGENTPAAVANFEAELRGGGISIFLHSIFHPFYPCVFLFSREFN